MSTDNIRKEICEYDSFGNLIRHKQTIENRTRSEESDDSYRPVTGSDLSWINAPPAPSTTDQKNQNNPTNSTINQTINVNVINKIEHCCHGHPYVMNPGYVVAIPIACTVCRPVDTFDLTPIIDS